MVVYYDFEEEFEWELDWDFEEVRKILKKLSYAELIESVDEVCDKDGVDEYLSQDTQDLLELNKSELIALIEECLDFDKFEQYFIDDLIEVCEGKAYEEYRNAKDWDDIVQEYGYRGHGRF
jgi:hypothetical protein